MQYPVYVFFDQMRFTDTHYNGWVCDPTCVGMGKLSELYGWQNSSFEDLNQADLHFPSSLLRVCPQRDSAEEQNLWLRLLLGRCKYELSLPTSVCWLLLAPPPFSVSVLFPVVELYRISCNPHGVRSE